MVEISLVNLTPHEVTVYSQDGQTPILTIPPSGTVARVTPIARIVGYLNGIPIRKVEYGDITGLPEPQENTVFIVSTVVLIAAKEKGLDRRDLVSPDTNPDSCIRDSSGKIIGVKYFQTL